MISQPAIAHESLAAASSARRQHTWPMILVILLCAAIIPETIVTFSTSPLKMAIMPIALPS
jgi:hypothetical protein